MNYIKLLNAAFSTFFFDDRLNPTHISLYMALFQEWNSSRFAGEFYVNRRDLMLASKIGSKSTYHRCVTDLDSYGYLYYFPSNNPYKGSKIQMAIIGTSDEPVLGRYSPILEQVAEQYRPRNVPVTGQQCPISGQAVDSHRPTSGQALVSTINNTKQVNSIKQPKGWQAVFNFFEEKGFDADEAKKFFEHYETRNWQTSDGKEIRDWRALAKNWMDRTELFDEENIPKKNQASQIKDNLRTTKNKDYGQPL
ncbi:hypothetical protein ESY86_17930 [Subsaximicrobium wynnwilliamsii]|uniref:Uncharacterized protein n=1 Tax=Subsaximicrobium wynnwilliamsii TaxID=291179 RepID=A0A5C6ZCF3_9FLAO|nr:hypothetical protein [Subsaximicrobium wynnwilliamsii]TXD81528.1 hypothetical protein ESY87_17930 [Subsaximicrobium wynnwilliamsii]TXD87194.1 hypothetical protein ESY86_17930 [Subsaximicrobium wynnwilliamsii]TXE00888.1 hypothetical protein ESY88_18180 [Subsaximicrobium wynnwilliamsii]